MNKPQIVFILITHKYHYCTNALWTNDQKQAGLNWPLTPSGQTYHPVYQHTKMLKKGAQVRKWGY